MKDKWSSLKLKLYLFSSTKADKGQDQKHLTVKEKKVRIFTGPPTYVYLLMTRINPYGVKTEPAEFCKSLENYKQSYKNNFNEEGKETRPVQTRRPGPSGSQGQLSPPVKSTL